MEENCCNWEPATPCCCGEPKNYQAWFVNHYPAIDPETGEEVLIEVRQDITLGPELTYPDTSTDRWWNGEAD